MSDTMRWLFLTLVVAVAALVGPASRAEAAACTG